MATDNKNQTLWEAPKKHAPQQKSTPVPEPIPPVDKKRRKIYFFISLALIVGGLVIVGFFILPFATNFLKMANNFNDEPLRVFYLRDVVNNGVSALIGAIMTYGGYKLLYLTLHPKPDTFPLKPSKPGQVLKPGE
ncbi:MAG: hypothetical protein Q6373_002910 [Candidatus Sigynarchaeota archaeon]